FHWDESFIILGTTANMAGLRAEDQIEISGTPTPWQPCHEILRQESDCRGLSVILARLQTDAAGPSVATIGFKASVSLRGTTSFNVLYLGKELDAKMRSPWPTPSFVGDALPQDSAVGADGFEAHWQALSFGAPRLFTSMTLGDTNIWKGSAFGVELME